MTNGTKILIGIVVIATIITGVIVAVSNNSKKQNNVVEKEETNIMDFLEQDNEENEMENEVVEENNIEENQVVENKVVNTINTNTATTVVNTPQVTGREEQESQQENTSANNEKIAIDLAKKEWGIDVDSYDYEVQQVKSEGIYEVTVRNRTGNRNAIAIYSVNVKTGAVTEK